MKIIISNVKSKIEVGGKEQLKGDIIGSVRDYLKVKKKGSYYAKKHNIYAGDYKYFCTPGGKFMTGFFPWVYQFLQEEFPDIEIELYDQRKNLLSFPDKFNYEVGDFRLDKTPYEYQGEALQSCDNFVGDIYWPRGIIDAATNAGKNTIIGGIHKNLKGTTLLLIHNREIFNQAVEFFGNIFDVGRVQGRHTEFDKPFVVAMYKTLHKRAKNSKEIKKQLSNINTLIVDESHRATARDYAHTLSWIDAGQRYFVSGTPLKMKDPIKKMSAIGLSGDVLYEIKNKDLIQRGVSLGVNVHIFKSTREYKNEGDYESTYRNIVMTNEMRRDLMCEYLQEHDDRQVLISVSRVKHGNFLADKIGRLFDCRVVFGESVNRDQLIDDFKNHKYRVLITTLLKEGVNAGIDTLIYANGGEAEISVLQYVGRVLRKIGKADTAHVVDFFDNSKYLDKHSRSRLRVYRKEGFKINYHYKANRYGTPQ
jgi:superfamily II DNA or RNA helicase